MDPANVQPLISVCSHDSIEANRADPSSLVNTTSDKAGVRISATTALGSIPTTAPLRPGRQLAAIDSTARAPTDHTLIGKVSRPRNTAVGR